MRRYGSFLVRWWQAEVGQPRLRIRHIQSDAELTVTLPADALDWMAARVTQPDRAPPQPAPDPGTPPQPARLDSPSS